MSLLRSSKKSTCGRKSVRSITAVSSNGLAPPQKLFCKQKWLDENSARHFQGNEKGSSVTDSLDFSYLDNTSGGFGFRRIHLFMFSWVLINSAPGNACKRNMQG